MCSAAKQCFSLVHVHLPQHACVTYVVTAAMRVNFGPLALPQTCKHHMVAHVLCSAQNFPTVARCMPHVRERAHCLESVHMLAVSTTRFTFGLGGAFQATQGVMTVATVCASISFTAALPLSRWNVSSSSCNVHWLAAGSSAMTRFTRAGC